MPPHHAAIPRSPRYDVPRPPQRDQGLAVREVRQHVGLELASRVRADQLRQLGARHPPDPCGVRFQGTESQPIGSRPASRH